MKKAGLFSVKSLILHGALAKKMIELDKLLRKMNPGSPGLYSIFLAELV